LEKNADEIISKNNNQKNPTMNRISSIAIKLDSDDCISNLSHLKHLCNNNQNEDLKEITLAWMNFGKNYKHDGNYDYTIQTENLLPPYFRASVKVSPSDNSNAWFAFGVTRTKVKLDNKKFMWCSEAISDCFAYNCNGMISDSEDSRKYGETYWQKANNISIVLDKTNNISFEKNGINFGIAFKNVKGPFYLAASLLYKNYEVEIIEIKEL
jgi:hypothetical protein